MDHLLAKRELYRTVCEDNAGDCTLHNTVVAMHIPVHAVRFRSNPASLIEAIRILPRQLDGEIENPISAFPGKRGSP